MGQNSGDVVIHDRGCPLQGTGTAHSDAAKRVSDTYRLHRLADYFATIGKWIAVALSDGTSDDTLYDSKSDAVLHQHHNELRYAYVQIGPHDMTPCDAETYLKVHRRLYDKGIRLADPAHKSGGMSLIPRVSREDMISQMRSITSGGRIRPSNLTFGDKQE